MKTIAEQIEAFEAKRAATMAQLTGIVNKSLETGETLDAEQETSRQTLEDEVNTIDKHITMLKQHQVLLAKSATAVSTASNQQAGTAARGGNVLSVKRNLAPGVPFARFARAIAQSKGNLMQAHEIAKQWQESTPEVVTSLKAAMAAGSTTDSDWAEPLVEFQTMQNEFIEYLRPMTIIGKMTGLRRVPFNIRVAGKTQGSTVGWVGQGAPKPVSELKFNETTLGMAKVAGIVVISQELARSSAPSAEMMIRDDLSESISQFMDEQFINPGIAAVANVSPASITFGAAFAASTGSTIALISDDVEAAMNRFIVAKLPVSSAVWIMHPSTVLSLSLKRTSQDVYAFRDELRDGTFFGLPVIQSESVPTSVSGGTLVVLAIAKEIFFADDGGVRVDASEQASLQMDSAPSAGAQSLVSLWQNNLIGIRAERYVNYAPRRTAAVTYIDSVAW